MIEILSQMSDVFIFAYVVIGALFTGKWVERGLLENEVFHIVITVFTWPYNMIKKGWRE